MVACYFLNQVVFPVVKLFLDPSSDEATSYFFQGGKNRENEIHDSFCEVKVGLGIKHQVDCARSPSHEVT